MIKFIKPMFKLIFTIIIFLMIILVVLTFFSYNPKEIEKLSVPNTENFKVNLSTIYSITTLNIGYGMYDKDSDSYLFGGNNSISSNSAKVLNNLSELLNSINKSDIYLFQDVDLNSKRSFNINEVDLIKNHFKNYFETFAFNNNCIFVPFPLDNPTGKVQSGLLTLNKFNSEKNFRHNLNNKILWPMSLIKPNLCVLETRINTSNGKELVIFNAELSSFKEGNKTRKEQLNKILNLMRYELAKGNYAICGGDFNMLLSNHPTPLNIGLQPNRLEDFHKDLLPYGFELVYDPSKATMRELNDPYIKGYNFEAITDGFIVTPNIIVKSIKTHDNSFKYSNHNPIEMKFKLK